MMLHCVSRCLLNSWKPWLTAHIQMPLKRGFTPKIITFVQFVQNVNLNTRVAGSLRKPLLNDQGENIYIWINILDVEIGQISFTFLTAHVSLTIDFTKNQCSYSPSLTLPITYLTPSPCPPPFSLSSDILCTNRSELTNPFLPWAWSYQTSLT